MNTLLRMLIIVPVMLAGLVQGCTTVSTGPRPSAIASALRVEARNLTTRTPATSEPAPSAEEFAARLAECQSDSGPGRRRRLIERYPDVAVEILRSTSPEQAKDGLRQLLAAAYDAVFDSSDGANWQQALLALATPSNNAASASALWQLRHKRLALIEQGRFTMAAQADGLDEGHEPPILRAESLRLRGIAYLLSEQPAEAATVFDRAATLAGGDNNMAAEIRLMQAEALRRAGRAADFVATWAAAVRQARGVRDPVLWERVLAMKPPTAAWPDPLHDAADVWMRIGRLHSARKTPSKALLAYANAQKECQDPIRQKQARIAQADTLLNLDQQGPALAILANLVDDAEPSVSGHAMAMIGVVRLQQGQTAQGLALLEKAVAASGTAGWPERSQAVADLGLARLMAGHKEEGLHDLHEAQVLFREEGKTEDLAQSLFNEATFLAGEGDKTDAEALRQQAAAILAE